MSDVALVTRWGWEDQREFLGLILAGGHWGDPQGGSLGKTVLGGSLGTKPKGSLRGITGGTPVGEGIRGGNPSFKEGPLGGKPLGRSPWGDQKEEAMDYMHERRWASNLTTGDPQGLSPQGGTLGVRTLGAGPGGERDWNEARGMGAGPKGWGTGYEHK